MRTKPQRFVAASVLIGLAGHASALETGAQLSLYGEHADNITQSSTNPVSDVAVTASASANVGHSGPILTLSGLASLSYTDYVDETFEPFWLLNSDITAAWAISESLTWNARNQTNQSLVDPFDVNIPSNVQNQNLFTTGPVYVAELGQATRFTLGGTYGVNTFSDSDADNDRLSAYVQLRRTIRPPLALSLNLRGQSVEFDDDLVNTNYDSGDAFFRFEWARAALTLRGDFGATRLQFVDSDAFTEPLTEIVARYAQRNGGTITAFFRDGLGDSATDFNDDQFAVDSVDGVTGFQSGGVFKETRGDLGWSRPLGRVVGTAAVFYNDRDFLTTDFDRIQYGVNVGLSFVLSPRWTLGLGGNWNETEFGSIARTDEFRSASLRLTRNFGKRLQVFGQVSYSDRESTDPTFTFDDTRIGVGFQYRVGAEPVVVGNRRGAQQDLDPGN